MQIQNGHQRWSEKFNSIYHICVHIAIIYVSVYLPCAH